MLKGDDTEASSVELQNLGVKTLAGFLPGAELKVPVAVPARFLRNQP